VAYTLQNRQCQRQPPPHPHPIPPLLSWLLLAEVSRAPGRPVPVAPLPTPEVGALYRRGILPDRPCTRQGKGAPVAAWPMPQPEVRASMLARRHQGAAPSMVVSSVYSVLIFSQPSCLYINRMCLIMFASPFRFRFSIIASEFESNFDLCLRASRI
jgi:hypothetical protein